MSDEEKWKDIDQLMYRELPPDRYCYIHNYIIDLKSQLQQKENIIKEVREYIKQRIKDNEEIRYIEMSGKAYIIEQEELLEILDKVGDNNE